MLSRLRWIGVILVIVLSGCSGTGSSSGVTAKVQKELASDTQTRLVQLYVATFGRAPDAAGMAYWVNQISTGAMTLELTAKSFFVQPEAQSWYPPTQATGDFIDTVYQNVLNRASDADGKAYWTTQLNSGAVDKATFVLAIINGALANTSTQGLIDAQLLNNKTEAGLWFATVSGSNDVTLATQLISAITSDTTSVTTAITALATARGSIIIRSDDQFTSNNGVVSGSGTQADPYIIDGWKIDASSYDTSAWPYIKVGIAISNTSKFFVIRNCKIDNADPYGAGISLTFLENGKVENCVITNSTSGISLSGVSNTVISENIISYGEVGIVNGSYSSDGITITGNTITYSEQEGIDFHYLSNSSASFNTVKHNENGIMAAASYSCTISNNTVQSNTLTGIELSYSGFLGDDNNVISYNDTSYNGTGIAVYGSHDSILYNTSNSNTGTGIRLDYIGLTDRNASYNTVANNTANNNGMDGLYVGFYCKNNTISNNTFSSNNALHEYYSDGTPWYYDININALPNSLSGNIYGTIYQTIY